VTRISKRNTSAWLLAVAVSFALALSAVGAGAQGGEYRLTIMHTSENHGHWEPYTQTISLGGIARRATLVKQIRAEGGNSLLVDAGDISQGTLYFIQHRYREGAAFYNALGYDATAIGNHEFDLGPKTFAENLVANASFPLIGTNLDFSGEPLLAGKIPSYVVKTVGGEKIGLLGFTTEDVTFNSSMGPTIRVKPRLDAAKAAIADLQQQGVNKIIALSHLGYPEDLRLAAAVDGIDIIASGHTFTLLGDPAKLNKALGPPEGPYPTVVQSPNGNPVLIVHAFQWGALLGRLNVTFDAGGVPIKWDGDPIVVDSSIPADPGVEALRQTFAEPLTTARQTVIGKNAVDLDGQARTLRTQESALGNLVADAMLDATRADDAQVALMNGGGIRTSLKAGDITVGGVLEVLPFGNRLVQMNLKGPDLLAALENGVSLVSEGAGRFPQVAGLRFAYDMSRPAGQRVTGVEIGTFGSGFQPLDPSATYRVVVNDFMAGGGDGYESLKLGMNVRGGDVPLDNALMDYIRARGTIEAHVEGRIVVGMLEPLSQSSRPVLQPTPVASATTTAMPQPTATQQSSITPTTPPTSSLPRPTPTAAQAARLQATIVTSAVPAAAQPRTTPVPPPSAAAAPSGTSLTWLCVVVPLGLAVIWGYRRRRRALRTD
jgi:5'-nucleotidase/UDP-sugar diphosphatase